MEVAAICPLPVGVVRWRSSPASPALTVIVKGTFTLDRDGEMTLAPAQEPLSPSRPAMGGLAYASDFVPYKPAADVVLTGHARAAEPARAIPARIRIGAI